MYFAKPLKYNRLLSSLFLRRSISIPSNVCVQKLNKRTLLKLSGPETTDYLQSMITNDIKNVKEISTLYSLLLNARGKVLYDSIIYRMDTNEYLVEYDATAAEYFHRHLLMYRLRKDVKIQPLSDLCVYALCRKYNNSNKHPNVSELKSVLNNFTSLEGYILSANDPRIEDLGIRIIVRNSTTLQKVLNESVTDSDCYTLLRYRLGIGEGVLDHPCGECLPFETNVDFLNGVSFTKGCYIGQELTAKAHFVLTVRKRLMPVILHTENLETLFPPECAIINETGQKMGRLRSHFQQYGLALLKYEESLKSDYLKLKGFDWKLDVIRPSWWPSDLKNSI
ncbi:putative transferase CAF17 homolog, mitochondrial [Stegodyphus dumicola]|uniref:putative transferase CAF17 homolog, mitochondrial n=1 Tax=Stegodyphus dumicola TaxID=202533 RepID=UPI0015B2730A|nr:putative transferase CAF17 homolog, mitochondrial [Stegodyphus dumicola]